LDPSRKKFLNEALVKTDVYVLLFYFFQWAILKKYLKAEVLKEKKGEIFA
jgi:hypothetical protein